MTLINGTVECHGFTQLGYLSDIVMEQHNFEINIINNNIYPFNNKETETQRS